MLKWTFDTIQVTIKNLNYRFDKFYLLHQTLDFFFCFHQNSMTNYFKGAESPGYITFAFHENRKNKNNINIYILEQTYSYLCIKYIQLIFKVILIKFYIINKDLYHCDKLLNVNKPEGMKWAWINTEMYMGLISYRYVLGICKQQIQCTLGIYVNRDE